MYTSSTIDRLQRGVAMALLMLVEAGHRAILSAIETGASWEGGRKGRRNGQLTVVFGHGTETQTMA